jgi:predicted DsbA family dithiol-disulfide isomerase
MEVHIGIGVYRKQDYEEILKISEDKDNMEPTWEKWKANVERTQEELQNEGVSTVPILVTPKELVKFCREQGLPVNGAARAKFISTEVRKLNEE